MKKAFASMAAGLIAGVVMLSVAPQAAAQNDINWSVNIGSPGHAEPAVYHAPEVYQASHRTAHIERNLTDRPRGHSHHHERRHPRHSEHGESRGRAEHDGSRHHGRREY